MADHCKLSKAYTASRAKQGAVPQYTSSSECAKICNSRVMSDLHWTVDHSDLQSEPWIYHLTCVDFAKFRFERFHLDAPKLASREC